MKLLYIIAGVALTLIVLIVFGHAIAGPAQCPPGQRDNCDTYTKTTPSKTMYACFPHNANPQGWTFVKEGCDEEEQPKETPATETIRPIFSYTATPPLSSTSTPIPTIFDPPTLPPGNYTATIVVPPKGFRPTNTPTPTIGVIIQVDGACSDICTCLLVTQAVIANDLKRQELELLKEANSCNAP